MEVQKSPAYHFEVLARNTRDRAGTHQSSPSRSLETLLQYSWIRQERLAIEIHAIYASNHSFWIPTLTASLQVAAWDFKSSVHLKTHGVMGEWPRFRNCRHGQIKALTIYWMARSKRTETHPREGCQRSSVCLKIHRAQEPLESFPSTGAIRRAHWTTLGRKTEYSRTA